MITISKNISFCNVDQCCIDIIQDGDFETVGSDASVGCDIDKIGREKKKKEKTAEYEQL